MNKICTDIPQSKRLIELGIDIKTADMDYVPFANNPKEYDCVVNVWNNEHEKDWISAWSLSALLGLLPEPDLVQNSEGTWLVRSWVKAYPWSVGNYSNTIDAVFEMIVKLKGINLL